MARSRISAQQHPRLPASLKGLQDQERRSDQKGKGIFTPLGVVPGHRWPVDFVYSPLRCLATFVTATPDKGGRYLMGSKATWLGKCGVQLCLLTMRTSRRSVGGPPRP
ncbi:hypothetical protein VTI74DRAFT_9338 [Chaetomium olivicolor]